MKLCCGETGATGLEPATSGVTGRRSNQLSYAPRDVGFPSMARTSCDERGPDRPTGTGALAGAATRRLHEGFRGVNRPARRWGPVSHCLKRLWVTPVIAVAITVATAGTAVALAITGTDGHDRITGSRAADTIDAKGGPDVVRALAGDDTIALGEGA